MGDRAQTTELSRRQAIAGAVAVGTSAWVAPSIVGFPAAIDQLEIVYSDQSTGTAFQFMGIHDFS